MNKMGLKGRAKQNSSSIVCDFVVKISIIELKLC